MISQEKRRGKNMAIRTREKREERRKKVSAKRRLSEHKVGGGSNHLIIPDGFDIFKPKEGHYRLDFFPYKVKSNPHCDAGDFHFERTYWVHRNVGPNNEWHLCLAKTFKKPCPICEYRAKAMKDPDVDEETIKALAPAERQLFVVSDLSDPEQKMIWDISYHLFGKQLDNKLEGSDEEDGYDTFADIEDGKTVRASFKRSEQGKWLETVDIEFKDRKRQYKEAVLEEIPCLDDMLKPTPYEKLKSIFLQIDKKDKEDEDEGDSNDEDNKKKETKKSSKKKIKTAKEADISVGDSVSYTDGDPDESYTVVKISGDGTSLTIEDEDGNTIKAVGVDEVEIIEEKPKTKATDKKSSSKSKKDDDDEEDEEDDDEEEKSKSKKSSSKSKKKEDDDEEEDDEDDEDEPKSKKKSKKSASKSKKEDDDDDEYDDWDEND